MKINILHLFYDYLNLYGDSANSIALQNYFQQQQIDCQITKHQLNNTIDLTNFDIIYIGSGEDSKIATAANYIAKYKQQIQEFVQSGGFVLTTGNAIRLLATDILGLLELKVEIAKKHQVFEALLTHSEIQEKLIGFYNHNCICKTKENTLFHLYHSKKQNLKISNLDYYKSNVYATLSIGPFYVRNYPFLSYIANKIILSKQKYFKLQKVNFNLEKDALKQFIKNYYPNI